MLKEHFHHKVILSGLVGDTPARTSLRNGVHHSGKVSCSGCWLEGGKEEGAVRFMGYLTKAPVVEFAREHIDTDLPETGMHCK